MQVLRLQPGDTITLFNGGQLGQGGEFEATVSRMGRSEVEVTVGAHNPVERDAARRVHLVVGMPANDRMDWLVEKATELGVASIQPLMTERSVLRLSGERADKKQAHWQSVAIAACEQCGLQPRAGGAPRFDLVAVGQIANGRCRSPISAVVARGQSGAANRHGIAGGRCRIIHLVGHVFIRA